MAFDDEMVLCRHTALRKIVAFSVGLFTVGYVALWCCHPTILAMVKQQNSHEYWWGFDHPACSTLPL